MADLLDLTLPLPVDRMDCTVDEDGMAAAVGGATAPDVEREDADVVLLIVFMTICLAKMVQAISLEGRLT